MTQRASRLRYSAHFIHERSGRIRERLRPPNLHAPSLAPSAPGAIAQGRKRAVMLWALLGLSCAVLVLA